MASNKVFFTCVKHTQIRSLKGLNNTHTHTHTHTQCIYDDYNKHILHTLQNQLCSLIGWDTT